MLSHYDIHNGIDNVLLMLYSTFKHRVKVIKKYGNIPEIVCYPAKLGQVFMNLINNAIQAIEGEGEVVISTYLEEREVVIEVADTGKGIPEELTNRLFEPFFTTKDTGQGTGLGLSISLGIMEDHNGRIEFFNNDKGGATFKVYLPLEHRQE
jgi:signal transduction histidine kinase